MPEAGSEQDRETVEDSAITADTVEARGVAAAATLLARTTAAPGAGDAGGVTDEALPAGTVIDHFVVQDQLGAGGMGVVVAARDQLLDRKVAIKVLRQEFGGRADSARVRLLREAQAMARLQHPNVVTVFEVGTHDGQVFLAMELVDGCTLGQWLRAQPRSTREIVDVFARAGRGLAAAHRLGMVHRDFKPENVLVGRDGQVRVTDFGLVGMAHGSVEELRPGADDRPLGRVSPLDQPLTRTGAVLGTPLYMSPEQHLRLPVTPQVDQFAFCVALYEALYGGPPFRGATVAELRASVLSGKPVAPAGTERRDVPPRLRAIVLRGLATAPDARWPSMDALLDALTRDPSASRRRRGVAAGGIALATAGAAVALGAFARKADGPPPCPPPDARLTGVWDAATRAAVEGAFAATSRPYAADTFTRAAGALDGYARGWVAMRTQACEATAVRHEQSPELLDRRMQCLDRRLVELGALTSLFRKSDPEVVDRAVSAALGLVPLASCADADALLGQVPLPADPAGRAEVNAVRSELAHSAALSRAGKPRDALAAVTPLVPRARALHHAPVLAEVLLQFGAANRDAGDPKVAEATVIEAARTGAEAKDDTLVAKALIEQMWIVGYRGGRRGEALALAPYIEAAVTRAGSDPIVLGGMYRYQAILLNMEGKFEQGLAVAQRALGLYQRANPEGREVATCYTTIGNLYSMHGDVTLARQAHEHARSIYVHLYGADHPDVSTSQTNLGNLLFKEGKLTAALEAYQGAFAIVERVAGPDAMRTGAVLSNIGMVLDAEERWGEARAINHRALAIYEKNLGLDHPDLAEPLSNLGDEAVAEHRWADAEAYYGRALAIREKALGKDNVRTAYAVEMLTQLRLAQHRYADALPLARRVLAIRETGLEPGNSAIGEALLMVGEAEAGVSQATAGLAAAERGVAILVADRDTPAPAELGDAWFVVARVARQAGRQARVQEAAAKAREAYGHVEPETKRTRKRSELDAWLAQRHR